MTGKPSYMNLILILCVSSAIMLIIAFSETLNERALVFVPLFFLGTGFALYYVTGRPSPAQKPKESLVPPTRTQKMFVHLAKKRDYTMLLQVAYVSYFFHVESVCRVNILKVWPVPESLLTMHGIDPEFLQAIRREYFSIKRGQVKISKENYKARMKTLLSHISILENSKNQGGKSYG